MVEQGVFVSKLAKSLQMLCHGYLEYNSTIEIIGHINLRIDNQKFDYIVNEQVSRQGGESTYFQSNSYHSLPPDKCCQTGERPHSGRFEDDGNLTNHQRVNDSMASMGGNCVKVDLSGPVPYTHSTHMMQQCLPQENCYSTAGIGSGVSRRRSHSRDSRMRSMEEDQAAAATHAQDHSFNHSSSSQKDREDIEMNGNGDNSRNEAAIMLALYTDRLRQQQRQDSMSIKAEPDRTDTEVDDPGAGTDSLMRDNDVIVTSSASSVIPSAHHTALAAHSGHSMMSTNAMAHPSFFDTSSLASQDVTEVHPGDSSYRPVIANESASGQDLSKQSSQNGEAMSLVVRSRTPPDLYPSGPTQLPQTADIGRESSEKEKHRCDYCFKCFRNGDLLKMHVALIHSRHNLSHKSLRNPSAYLSPHSPSAQSNARRASQSPGHQSTSSSSSRSKSQSPIAVMSHSHPQPLSLAHSLSSLPSLGNSTSMGMSLPPLPNPLTSSPHSCPSASSNVAAAMAAFAQSYSMEPSQMGPMRGGGGQDVVGGGLGGQAYQCHMCHMPFVNWALLAQHQSQCPRRGPHRCEKCGKAFRSKTSLTDHINTIHKGMVFTCKGCHERFKWRTHIYQHKRKCHALQNANFESTSFFIEETPPQQPDASPSLASSSISHEDMEDPEHIE